MQRVVRPFYRPPTLVLRQALSAFYLAYLTGWKHLPGWLARGTKTLPVAAGAVGMGCIGFPNHPVWEMTTACNLRCRHCHASGGRRSPEELSTAEGKKLLREIASIDAFRMLAFTGGEPMVRPDIYDLAEYAAGLGLPSVIATNATLIDTRVARRLRDCGVAGLAISLDAATPELHDYIRNSEGAFKLAVRGIEACKEAGMALQINVTAMEYNREELPQILAIARKYQAEIVLNYQLVPVGRGETIKDRELGRQQNEWLMHMIAENQKHAYTVIEPVAGPQYWAHLIQQKKVGPCGRALARTVFKGCVAGSGLVYLKPNGDVWACPFLPISAGNVREKPLPEIWENAPLFSDLRRRGETLQGKCATCEYNPLCGGCRGRAYAHSGNYLAEDPSCFLHQDTTHTRPPGCAEPFPAGGATEAGIQ
ncbi:MAG: radical SAM protein [Clostridia bacterium]|nr:MAG: radical SAM protein [Clostridia bacterium]